MFLSLGGAITLTLNGLTLIRWWSQQVKAVAHKHAVMYNILLSADQCRQGFFSGHSKNTKPTQLERRKLKKNKKKIK